MALKSQYQKLKGKLFLEGAFSFANFTLLNGIFLIGFALALGANNLEIGILVAIPLFANIIQLMSAFILETTGTKKVTSIVGLFLGRILWIPIILIAFGFIKEYMLIILAGVLILSSVFNAVGNLSLLSWMKDIVPIKKLANFWGKRNIYASAGGIIVYIAGAYLIDVFIGIEIFGYLFTAALVLGMIGLGFLLFVPGKKINIKAIKPRKFIGRLAKPFKDEKFKPLLQFGLLWGFAINFASPFFLVFMVDDLRLSFLIISIFLGVDSLARIYGLNLWRNLAEKYGAKPLLVVCATVTSFVPLGFVFINTRNYFFIPVIFAISAISYAAVDITFGQILFKSAPRKYDAYYLSAFTSLTGLVSGLGPIVGGLVALLFRTGWGNTSYIGFLSPLKYVFLISFILRVLCLPLIKNLHEPKAKDVSDIIEKMKTLRFASFFVNIYSITDIASKIVLEPHKQFFILQRKTAERAKKDLSTVLTVLSRISSTMTRVQKKVLPSHEKRITELTDVLNKQVDKLEYVEGSELQKIPQRVLSKMESLESSIEEEDPKKVIKKKAESVQKAVETNQEKLDKVYNKEIV
jgi:MFS family permease